MYATLQDLIDRFGADEVIRFADRDRDGEADAAVIAQVLGDAQSLVDGYVGRRYRLPLAAPVDPILVRLVCDLARASYHGASLDMAGPVAAAEKKALAVLRDIAAGQVQLTGAVATGAEQAGGVAFAAGERVFTGDRMKGFVG